jgi:hypothetical protein
LLVLALSINAAAYILRGSAQRSAYA